MATTITANGINFPDGSAGTPSIGGSDTNTGLFTGSDIIGFATGGSERLKIDASGNVSIANDTGKLRFGASNDLQIYHDGSNSYLYESGTGSLVIASNGNGIWFQKNVSSSENLAVFRTDGACELNYDNVKKFETTSSGATVTGSLSLGSGDLTLTGNVDLEDSSGAGNNRIKLGTGDDLQIFHNGSQSKIVDNTGNELRINANTIRFRSSADDETYANFIDDGAVELYYNNTEVFATQTNGIKLHNGGASYLYFYDVNTSTIAMYTNSVNLRWYDDVNNDNIMQLSQNGDLNIDGSYSNSGVDYAEYFESTDGSAIAIGTTVVLEDGKVRAATSSETPIGVIRPKTSGTSVTGGVNQLNWQGKYLVDDYDGQIMESAVHCTWTDDNEVNQQCWKDRPPTGVTIPSDAVETTRERPKLNPLFDESKTYVPRSERDEWNCVGLLGQIPITKGQPTSSNWIKMKDKTSTVELWMVK